MRFLFLAACLSLLSPSCLGEWTKTIACPAGRIYRDIRIDAGRSEYCDHLLPGSLQVKDGPSRFWFSSDLEGATGKYYEGRQVGKWTECSRFGHCEQKDYPSLYPEERQRAGIKNEIPITYKDGQYVFDFASCRGTQLTHTEGEQPALELNIGARTDGCLYAYATEDQIQHGSESHDLGTLCIIPFQLGKLAFASLDLLSEMPKASLPQYCKQNILTIGPTVDRVTPHSGQGSAQIFEAEYDTGNNGAGIAQARLHFQAEAASRTDRCVVRYDPASKSLFLLSDQPGKYLGPIAADGDGSLANKECLLSGCSNAQLLGTILTVQFAIRFNPAQFAGQHRMYLELVDTQRHAIPAGDVGRWTVPAANTETAGGAWPSDRSCPATTSSDVEARPGAR